MMANPGGTHPGVPSGTTDDEITPIARLDRTGTDMSQYKLKNMRDRNWTLGTGSILSQNSKKKYKGSNDETYCLVSYCWLYASSSDCYSLLHSVRSSRYMLYLLLQKLTKFFNPSFTSICILLGKFGRDLPSQKRAE